MKSELPPLRMIVGRGTLTCADEYSEERLDTYRLNSVVDCDVSQEIYPKLLRKYWAILGRVVETCPTKWNTAKEASDAFKYAFGITEKTILLDGTVRTYPGSITSMENPEFEDYFDGVMALLHRMTGVDPLTLWKVSADTGDRPAESEASVPHDAAEEGDGGDDHSPAVADTRTINERRDEFGLPPVEEGAPVTREPDERRMVENDPMNTNALQDEAVKQLIDLAASTTATPKEKMQDLENLRQAWTEYLAGHPVFVNQCFATAAKVIRGELQPEPARRYLWSIREK